MVRVNLGCPNFHEGWVCVDLHPRDSAVVRDDAVNYMTGRPPGSVSEVMTKNLLEHLPNVQQFLKACYEALEDGGRICVITDNAEWLPFYLPVAVPRLGVGAHAVKKYALRFNTVHYSIFSPMHLTLHLTDAGFSDVRVNRLWRYAFARLRGIGFRRRVR